MLTKTTATIDVFSRTGKQRQVFECIKLYNRFRRWAVVSSLYGIYKYVVMGSRVESQCSSSLRSSPPQWQVSLRVHAVASVTFHYYFYIYIYLLLFIYKKNNKIMYCYNICYFMPDENDCVAAVAAVKLVWRPVYTISRARVDRKQYNIYALIRT